jgi:hypothetical protein
MSLRRLITVLGLLAASAALALAAAGTASAEAYVFHGSDREPFVGSFYNICDLAEGPDSPMFTASGFSQQQLTLVQVSELHFILTAHEVVELNGTYPDGRHVVFNSTFDVTELVNLDPSSLETGIPVLASALVVTSTQHGILNVQGNGSTPDEKDVGIAHATFTPDLKLVSLVVSYQSGCS